MKLLKDKKLNIYFIEKYTCKATLNKYFDATVQLTGIFNGRTSICCFEKRNYNLKKY